MTLKGLSTVILLSGSPEFPNWYDETLFTPLMHRWACSPANSKVHTKALSLILAFKRVQITSFQNQYGIFGLLQTWIMLDKILIMSYHLFVCFFQFKNINKNKKKQQFSMENAELNCCFLWSSWCFLDSETSPDFPLTWEWEYNDWIFHFRVSLSFKLNRGSNSHAALTILSEKSSSESGLNNVLSFMSVIGHYGHTVTPPVNHELKEVYVWMLSDTVALQISSRDCWMSRQCGMGTCIMWQCLLFCCIM